MRQDHTTVGGACAQASGLGERLLRSRPQALRETIADPDVRLDDVPTLRRS